MGRQSQKPLKQRIIIVLWESTPLIAFSVLFGWVLGGLIR